VSAQLPSGAPLLIVLYGSAMEGATMRRWTGYEFALIDRFRNRDRIDPRRVQIAVRFREAVRRTVQSLSQNPHVGLFVSSMANETLGESFKVNECASSKLSARLNYSNPQRNPQFE
jgi:hypothetical protein